MRSWITAGLLALALPSAASASETATYTYDTLGRLKTVTSVQAGQTVTRTYTYDLANNRSSRVTAISAGGSGLAAQPSDADRGPPPETLQATEPGANPD